MVGSGVKVFATCPSLLFFPASAGPTAGVGEKILTMSSPETLKTKTGITGFLSVEYRIPGNSGSGRKLRVFLDILFAFRAHAHLGGFPPSLHSHSRFSIRQSIHHRGEELLRSIHA
jgi:hypothetical protein